MCVSDYELWNRRLQKVIQTHELADVFMFLAESPISALRDEARSYLVQQLCLHGNYVLAEEQSKQTLKGMQPNLEAISINPPALSEWKPQRVFLFSGHMIDTPNRKEARFPPAKEKAAADAIAAYLDARKAGAEDLALAQAAAGGDILFLEACLQRNMQVQVLLPFPESEFVVSSILPSIGGERWQARYIALSKQLSLPIRIMSDALWYLPKDALDIETNPFSRCNLWLLYSAFIHGLEKVNFLCLWNGAGGDGPGGTVDMLQRVKSYQGHVQWIDTREL